MKKFTFILTVLMFALNINAQNELWPNEPVNTGSNATYLVNSVTFNGNDLVFGKIGAFFINDLGNYQCGGWQTWTGSNTQIAAMGDDATTEEKMDSSLVRKLFGLEPMIMELLHMKPL
ncbi:MAG: hypothetical protein CM15mP107_4810 [Bacteroidota bacterium]|nr:MAG: hypothetical protein CM15mP107_4810 [Bacteroidota bacterium]